MSNTSINATVIMNLPVDILRTIPALEPPSGVSPDFEHPATTLPLILSVCNIFLAKALICYLVRMYTKACILRKWTWDDLTLSFGFFCSIIVYGFFVNGAVHGATSRHEWEVHLDRLLNSANLMICSFTVIFSQPALAFIKGSLFIQYYSIFRRLWWFRMAIWIGGTIHCVVYSAIIVLGCVLAIPRKGQNWLELVLSDRYLLSTKVSIPIGAFGLAMDLYLFIIPIPAILKLQMAMSRKIGLIVVFTTGGIALIAGMISFILRVRLQLNHWDSAWQVGYFLTCNQVEMLTGIIVCCMPSVKQFWTHFWKKSFAKSDSRSSRPSFAAMIHGLSSSDDGTKSDEGLEERCSSSTDPDTYQETKMQAAKIRVTQDFTVEREGWND